MTYQSPVPLFWYIVNHCCSSSSKSTAAVVELEGGLDKSCLSYSSHNTRQEYAAGARYGLERAGRVGRSRKARGMGRTERADRVEWRKA